MIKKEDGKKQDERGDWKAENRKTWCNRQAGADDAYKSQ